MTAAATLKSITSRLVPDSLARGREEPGQGKTHDQHLQEGQEEFLLPLEARHFPQRSSILPTDRPSCPNGSGEPITYLRPDLPLPESSSTSHPFNQEQKNTIQGINVIGSNIVSACYKGLIRHQLTTSCRGYLLRCLSFVHELSLDTAMIPWWLSRHSMW